MPDEIAGQQRLAAEKALGHEQEAPKAPVPSGLRNEFSDASYKMAAPKKSASGPSMQDEMAAKASMLQKARKALE